MTGRSETPKIRYDEGCLAAHALNLIGDRWALLVTRELMFAAKRFQMLRAGLPGVSASVLTGRLAQLEQAGVVAHDDRLGLYSLTEAGAALLPVLEALCRWALIVPGHDPSRFISPSALMISMGVTFLRDGPEEEDRLAGFDFGAEAFEMRIAGRELRTTSLRRPETPFVLSGTGNTLAAAVYGAVPVEKLAAAGTVGIEGDAAAAQAFVDRFRLHG